MSSTTFTYLALSMALSAAPLVDAFTPTSIQSHRLVSSTDLKYRSIHHGPDVEPLTDNEKLGAGFTKMDKDKIDRYGPGDFTQYVDHHSSDLFDGGDSEMGLAGDGNFGIKKVGRDSLPHMTRTLSAKMDQATLTSMSYTDELLQSNPGMDHARAQQLENWATQNEVAMSNRYMNDRIQQYHDYSIAEYEHYEGGDSFAYQLEAGDEVEGLITLKSQINGVAAHGIMLKNPYMGYAKFRAGFVGNESNEWMVTPSNGFLHHNEATHFVVSYNPHNPGTSSGYFVIETEDFKKTWKIVGSTGEYEF